jgi:hypothetical protein
MVANFLNKPVVKKKVKFTEEVASEDDEPKILGSENPSKSGVNQFQDLLEEEVAKENEADDEEEEDQYDDEESNDSDDDIFQ